MTELLYLAALVWSSAFAAQFLNGIWRLPADERRLRAHCPEARRVAGDRHVDAL